MNSASSLASADSTSADSLSSVGSQRSGFIPGLIILPGETRDQFTPCYLLDFDQNRCRLRVDISYTLSQRDIQIRVLDSDDDGCFELFGRVVSTRRHSINAIGFECEFVQPLSSEVQTMMEQMAIDDRRSSERNHCLVRVNVCRIERGRVVTEASMVETSDQGLRLTTAVPLNIGEQVIVQLPTGEDLLVAIVWSKKADGTNQFGGSVAPASLENSVLHSIHRLSQP